MTILYITVNSPPLFSGRAKQAHSLRDVLLNYGCDIKIISLDQDVIKYRGETYRLNYFEKFNSLKYMLTFVLTNNIKIVHIHGLSYALILAPFFRLKGVKTILHMSSFGYDDPATLKKSLLKRYLCRCLNYFVVQKISLANSENEIFIPNLLTIDTVASKRTLIDGKIHIIISGVICQRKKQLEIITWLGSLNDDNVIVHFAGSHQNNYNEYDKLYVSNFLTIAKSVTNCFIHGTLSKIELSSLMSKCQYFFAISAQEGLSNSYIECLASNLIPIAEVDNVDELFDTVQISNAVLTPKSVNDLNYFELQDHLSKNQHDFSQYVQEYFSEDSVVRHYKKLYGIK